MALSLYASVILLASSPAVSAAAPEPAPAIDHTPPDPFDVLVVVRVEVDGGNDFATLLDAEVTASLRDARVRTDLPDHAPLEITVTADTESIGAYEVVYLHKGDVRESWSCRCTGDELRARLAANVTTVWNTLVLAKAPLPQASLAAPAAASAPLDVESDARPRERGLGLWACGVTMTAIGTGVVVGTGALLISDAAANRNRSPVAVGLMSSGVAMVAGGVTLWAIGAHQRKRPTLSVLPAVRHRGVAFTVSASF